MITFRSSAIGLIVGSDGNIFTIRPDGTGKTYLTNDGPDYVNGTPAWSYDGTAIVHTRQGPDGAPHIWTMNADGSGKEQRTFGTIVGTLPVFSPDGMQILFDGPAAGTAELWVVNTNGTNPHAITNTTGSQITRTGLTLQWATNGAYSPDEKKIVYASTQSGRTEIWVMNADGSGQTQLTFPDDTNAPDANDPSWSPDGSKIVFWSGFAREYGNIYTMNADGSDRTQLTFEPAGENSDNPAWAPDGKSIMFESPRDGPLETWFMNSDGTNARVMFSGSYGGGRLPIANDSPGNETIWGGAGDMIQGGAGNVTIGGVSGDTIIGGTGNYFIDGSLGNQSIIGGSAGNGTIWGGAGDTIRGAVGNVTIGGGPGDTITGGTGNAFIDASLGGQFIVGGSAGNGTIWGGAGDTIQGGAGNVTIGGGSGDTITGGTGNYFIDAHLSNQSVVGGGTGNGTIWGGAGDTIRGGAGNLTIGGGAGDTIIGGTGTEFIDGSLGNQSIVGGSGNATIWGAAGDTIQGASGSGQALIGFKGGNQTAWDNGATSTGNDSIFGFSQSSGDRISLNSATDNASTVTGTASTVGGNTTVTLSDGSHITLLGVSSINTSFFTTH